MNTRTFLFFFSSFLSLVDSHPSSCSNGRLLTLPRSSIITIRQHQPIRYASSGSLPSHKRITLPALSPTMETGTLRSWAKKEGEKVAEGMISFKNNDQRRNVCFFQVIYWLNSKLTKQH